jgi:outer membrane lipoprotein-sorting protein
VFTKLQEVYSLRLRRALIAIVAVAAVFQSACLVRKRTTVPPGVPVNRPLLRASKEDLIKRIREFSDPIESFNMKVDMSPTVGNLQGGTVTDYTSIIGYLLFRKPDQIRVIGLEPAIHGTAFDMVSIGNDFRVSIPYRNEFIEGRNDAPASSQNKLENLRPAAFLTALLIKPPEPTELTILEDDTDETRATYILMVIERDGDQLKLLRNVYFDRYTLNISRQKTFDLDGYIASDTKYSDWKNFGGTRFPATIDIERPKDGYEVVLTVTDLKLNTAEVTPEKFVLNPPPNAKVRSLK